MKVTLTESSNQLVKKTFELPLQTTTGETRYACLSVKDILYRWRARKRVAQIQTRGISIEESLRQSKELIKYSKKY